MKSEYVMLALSILAGMAVWIIDTAVDTFMFRRGTFLDVLLLRVPGDEALMRPITVLVFLILGGIAAVYAGKRRRAAEALRRSREQLLQAQKIAAIGRSAGSIAHDLKNQLTVIKGYCDLLLRGMDAQNALREPLEEIRDAAQRCTTLAGQLLAIRPQTGAPPQGKQSQQHPGGPGGPTRPDDRQGEC